MSTYEVIKVKIKQINSGDKIKLYSYKDENHFKELWGFDSFLSSNTIVIVWDGIAGTIPESVPGSLVDTNKYLTPIDWAVGYSLAIKDGTESGHYPDLKILIFDSASDKVSHSDSVEFVYQSSNMDIMSMPWIRIFSAKAPSGRNIDAFYKQLVNGTEDALPSMKETFVKDGLDLDSIKRIWVASLTRPSTHGDHHAIANLVGPLLLTEEVGGDLHVNALQALMRSIGLLPDHKEGNASKENGEAMLCAKNPWVDVKEYNSDKLKLILIDDMFQISWGKILCRAVGLDYKKPSGDDGKDQLVEISEYDAGQGEKIVVKAASSAEWILEKLCNDENKDKRFKFSLDNDGDSKEILFLDLRLYSGNFKKEVAFFEKLANFANQHLKKDANRNLPWPGITNDEIVEIQNWIDNPDRKQEDPQYIKALTLLPRILALTDLSLPIVLFSSTGRRDITEKLKSYGNIITVFEKPRFTVDIPLDIALQTKCKFLDAMEMAHMILQARQKCRTIIATGNKVTSGVEDTEDKGYHIELFIDESFLGSSQETIIVGGLFAIYSADNVEAARSKADDFDNDLVKAGVRYFHRFSVGENAECESDLVKNKKDSCSGELARALRSKCSPDHLFFVGLECTMENAMDNEKNNSLFYPKSGDNLFRMTLNSLIEFFLSETIPALFPEKHKEVSISIYAGTRVQQFELDEESKLNIIKYKTGFESFTSNDKDGKPNKHVLQTTNRDTLFPIISDILSFHNMERNMYRVVGITLPYKTGKVTIPVYFFCRNCKKNVKLRKSDVTNVSKKRNQLTCECRQPNFYPDYRAFHYVADEILNHVGDVKKGNGYGKEIKLSNFGFNDTLVKAKDTLIASRYFDMKDIVSSIVQVNLDYISEYSITRFLLNRQAKSLESISGSNFCRITARLASGDRVTKYEYAQFLQARGKKRNPMETKNRSKTRTRQKKKTLLVVKEGINRKTGALICTCEISGNTKEVVISHKQISIYDDKNREEASLRKAVKGDIIYATINETKGVLYGGQVERKQNT